MSLSVEQRRILLAHPAGWIASGFGSGLSPIAPGTAGSLVALLPRLALRELPWPWDVLVVVAAFSLATWAAVWGVRGFVFNDPGRLGGGEFVGKRIGLVPFFGCPR